MENTFPPRLAQDEFFFLILLGTGPTEQMDIPRGEVSTEINIKRVMARRLGMSIKSTCRSIVDS